MDIFQSLILLSVNSRINFKGVLFSLSLFFSLSIFNSNVMWKGLPEMGPVRKTCGKTSCFQFHGGPLRGGPLRLAFVRIVGTRLGARARARNCPSVKKLRTSVCMSKHSTWWLGKAQTLKWQRWRQLYEKGRKHMRHRCVCVCVFTHVPKNQETECPETRWQM